MERPRQVTDVIKAIQIVLVSDDYVLEDGDTPYTPEDEVEGDAPYSPGEATSPPCSAELQRKVDQLHRMISDIEEKKQKIDSIVGMSPPQVYTFLYRLYFLKFIVKKVKKINRK